MREIVFGNEGSNITLVPGGRVGAPAQIAMYALRGSFRVNGAQGEFSSELDASMVDRFIRDLEWMHRDLDGGATLRDREHWSHFQIDLKAGALGKVLVTARIWQFPKLEYGADIGFHIDPSVLPPALEALRAWSATWKNDPGYMP
jgi:hypothetical protein